MAIKKRSKSLPVFLCAAMLCGSLTGMVLPTAQAATGTQSMIEQVVGALEIIEGDTQGNLNLSKSVTRAEFAKMLVAASTLKDTVSSAGNASPFRDVPYTSWSANYIKTAVEQGWLTGYLDSTYRPNQAVTAAEAMTAAVKLLGYTTSDFAGSFPSAQMAIAKTNGLTDGITKGTTDTMTRQDCMRLFYNLLSANTKAAAAGEGTQAAASQKYCVKLGYTLDSNGDPDYTAILEKNIDGPVVVTAEGWAKTIDFTPAAVYRDDAAASTGDLQPWDVLYYSKPRNTVWAYSRKVTGTLEAVTPSKDAPTGVTVAGQSFAVSGTLAVSQLGTGGGIALGDSVTLLFGRDGSVAAVYPATQLQTAMIGVITKTGGQTQTVTATGATYTQNTIEITASDGQSYTVPYSKDGLTVGNMVKYTPATQGAVMLMPRSGIAGKFSAENRSLGNYELATSCTILEVAGSNGKRIYPARLDGMDIQGSQILHYETNTAGQITQLFLKDCTGDAYQYGLVLGAAENTTNNTSNYTFLINGQKSSMSMESGILGLSIAPAQFTVRDNKVTAANQLTALSLISSIDSAGLTTRDGETYTLWDDASVYLYNDDGDFVSLLNKNELSLDTYRLTAYYDKPDSQGGRVRVIIAKNK